MVKTISMFMTLVRAVFLLPAKRWWSKTDLMEPDDVQTGGVRDSSSPSSSRPDDEDAVSYRDLFEDGDDDGGGGELEWPADLSFACEWVPECLKEISDAMKQLGPTGAAAGHSTLSQDALDKLVAGLAELRSVQISYYITVFIIEHVFKAVFIVIFTPFSESPFPLH